MILFSAAVDYFAAAAIFRISERRIRRRYLFLSLSVNLGLLVLFKYSYFIANNIQSIADLFNLSLHGLGIDIILPLGISFYTFQTISYTIDVYRGVSKPVNNFITFLAYVIFWPQLIAGPILRASEVIPQFENLTRFSSSSFVTGIKLITSGLFLKVVLADNIAPMVDEAFAVSAGSLGALDVWVASFLFGFQIYFDFAGYSSIAIGSAKLLGFDFPDNFNWPYLAKGPKEFWGRWHISLSSWIRDYLYLPLCGEAFRTRSTGGIAQAGSRAGQSAGRTRALFVTWFLMGLWHGAAWNFALWGIYHAAVIFAYRRVKILKQLSEFSGILSWIVMLLIAMAGWISFRAESLAQAVGMYTTICNPLSYGMSQRELDWYSYLWAAAITLGHAYLLGSGEFAG